MYNIPLTTGIGYLKSLFSTSSNSQLKMGPRKRKLERNLLAALIALSIFSLIIFITLLCQLKNFLLTENPLFQPKATHFNTQEPIPNEPINANPNPLAPHQHIEPPQANQPEMINYFNSRFHGIPNLQHLRIQVRENMDAIFEGKVLPWPEVMERGFAYTTMAEIDREVGLQRRRIRDLEPVAQEGNAMEVYPRERGDTPEWMLALFENGNGYGNAVGNSTTSFLHKHDEQNSRNEKLTCPICTDELPAKVSIAKPCKHRFCIQCLEDWMVHLRGRDGGRGKGQKIRCPVCAREIRRVGSGGGLMDRVGEALRRG
ncbi:uncharacterized protein EAF01_004959 [Botrytis porri]|uniref:RING-type domain-containing protein n=1 Tax=Botrytis porri TaxID=87229 RepID=A0A4Z1L1T3_9HELO|nr:uncharacterized protein EAF01_004959 [Botrytis porri]KAF7907372.1 hypothetical protein EAF01_004959 [Botrytis porri]TGO90782.1 hypothetical protein BPOR_0051g00170 [Botrytis porri]